MNITVTEDHWIEGVRRIPVPGGSAMNVRRFLIIHNTSGWTGESSVAFWLTPAAGGASAHIVIDRDGSIIQCRPFNRTCGHAGASSWKDPNTGKTYSGLNSCSIGIELANAADMARSPDVYPSTMGPLKGKPVPRISARHKNGGALKNWETYTPEQMKSLAAVSKALIKRYNLDSVAGHDQISPGRKVDPGPAFNWSAYRSSINFWK